MKTACNIDSWGINTEEYLSKEDYLPEENIYLKEDYLSKEEYLPKEETILCMHQDLTNQQIQLENTVGEYSWRIQLENTVGEYRGIQTNVVLARVR